MPKSGPVREAGKRQEPMIIQLSATKVNFWISRAW